MKTLLSILFLFTALSCSAQYHNVEGIRVVGRSDSTTISNVGQIQFDADDDKFRFNDGTGWFSFLKDDATLPYWPLTGTKALTGNTSINGAFNLNLGTSGSKLNKFHVWSSDTATLISDDGSGGGETAKLVIDHDAGVTLSFTAPTSDNYIRLTDNNSIEMQVSDNDSFFNNIGLTPTQFFVSLLDNSSGLSSGFTMTTTETIIGTLSGDDNISLHLESEQERLRIAAEGTDPGSELQINLANPNVVELTAGADNLTLAGADLQLSADNQALINVASGNNVNRVILQPGLSSFTLLDTDGMTLDVQILVQPGDADILRIVKDESVTVFEINADGSIVYGAPPTDCTGLATNTIWSDGGTLKLCP